MLSSLSLRAPPNRYSSLPLLGEHLEGLCESLSAQGYPREAIRRRVLATPLLSATLCKAGVHALRELTAADLSSLAPQPTYWTAQLACSLVRSLTEYLQDRGELASAPTTPTDTKIDAFCRYLKNVRGLGTETVAGHRARAAPFLRSLEYDTHPLALRNLDEGDIESFLLHEGQRVGRVTMQKVAATLRALLRYLAAQGEAPSDVYRTVASSRCYRGERLPRVLPWDSVRSLLHSIDRTTPKGRRDFAILLMIATYGLRAGEIAALKLDDVQWRLQQIRIPRPKVGPELLQPLTDDVAAALLDYLRNGRGTSEYRQLFLRVRIPPGPIKSSAVADVFDEWSSRAGVQRLPKRAGGPHCLRHSVATHLLRAGASVKTIGDLLGHRSVESTEVYLRLQVDDLRAVALPLPTGVALDVTP